MPQCPVCAERVPANARVCPHCDTRLGKSRSRNEDDDIEDYEDAPPRRSITKSKRRNSSSGIPMWVIVLIILGCVPLLAARSASRCSCPRFSRPEKRPARHR